MALNSVGTHRLIRSQLLLDLFWSRMGGKSCPTHHHHWAPPKASGPYGLDLGIEHCHRFCWRPAVVSNDGVLHLKKLHPFWGKKKKWGLHAYIDFPPPINWGGNWPSCQYPAKVGFYAAGKALKNKVEMAFLEGRRREGFCSCSTEVILCDRSLPAQLSKSTCCNKRPKP